MKGSMAERSTAATFTEWSRIQVICEGGFSMGDRGR